MESNEIILLTGIRQIQKLIKFGKLMDASNACTNLLIEYGGDGLLYEEQKSDSSTKLAKAWDKGFEVG